MSSLMQQFGLDQWSVDDRLRLMEEIWDSLSGESLGDMPQWHREILEQRLTEADGNPEARSPWEEVLARLRSR